MLSYSYFAIMVGLGGVLLVFFVYPALLWLVRWIQPTRKIGGSNHYPTVTMLTVVRNARAAVEKKVADFRGIDYPVRKLDLLLGDDGSDDGTGQLIDSLTDSRITARICGEQQGKNQVINRVLSDCSGDIILFCDISARLAPDAVKQLVRHFADPDVGGVCGQMVYDSADGKFQKAQKSYLGFDSTLKKMESDRGWLTSNTGAIYAIRKELFRPVDPAVTDDLYTCLTVIGQGYRFLFEEKAMAFVPPRSKNSAHELQRRRRIVARSLRGIALQRKVLNPFRFGFFSFGLFINKIFRRLLPVFLMMLAAGSLHAAIFNRWVAALLWGQIVFYFLACLSPFLSESDTIRPLKKTASLAYYFCLGCLGTFLGLVDFLRGRKISSWQPKF